MGEAYALFATAGLFGVAAMGALVALWSEGRVLHRLEKAHPDIIRHFDELWGPTSKLLRRFIWRDTHEGMGDPLLSRLVNRTCWAWIIAGLGMVAAIAGAVALAFLTPTP